MSVEFEDGEGWIIIVEILDELHHRRSICWNVLTVIFFGDCTLTGIIGNRFGKGNTMGRIFVVFVVPSFFD